MQIRDLLASGAPSISFEFFPPKSEEAARQLEQTIADLAGLEPTFVSVTGGAGGSTREKTIDIVTRIRRETGIEAAAHLTCVGATQEEIGAVLERLREAGVENIIALRGDPPVMGEMFAPHPQGYASAADLVSGLKKLHPFEISVAAYPEVHPEAGTAQSDLDNLKRKIDAGATRAISQFFFSPDCFFRFRDAAAAAGITAEIVPGILPVTSVAQTRKFAGLCGAAIPGWMDRLFEGLDELPAARQLVSATIGAELCRQLYAGGERNFHFYTLNRAELAYAICHLLGVRPTDRSKEQAA